MEKHCKDRTLATDICYVLFHILHLVTLSESLDERLINEHIAAREGDNKTHLICETGRHEQISWYRTTLGDSAICPNSSALTTTHQTHRLVFCDLIAQHRQVQSRFTNRFRLGGLASDHQNDLIFEKVEKKDAGLYACVGKEGVIQLLNVTVTTNDIRDVDIPDVLVEIALVGDSNKHLSCRFNQRDLVNWYRTTSRNSGCPDNFTVTILGTTYCDTIISRGIVADKFRQRFSVARESDQPNDLVIRGVEMSDEGLYACEIGNGTIFHTINLNVEKAEDVEALVGEGNKHLPCSITESSQSEQLFWYRKTVDFDSRCPNNTGVMIHGISFCHVIVSIRIVAVEFRRRFSLLAAESYQANELIIREVEMTDAGLYVCFLGSSPMWKFINFVVRKESKAVSQPCEAGTSLIIAVTTSWITTFVIFLVALARHLKASRRQQSPSVVATTPAAVNYEDLNFETTADSPLTYTGLRKPYENVEIVN